MPEKTAFEAPERQLIFDGRARSIAVLVTLGLLAMTLWAAKLDYDSPIERNKVPLDVLSASFKILALVGLVVVARRLASRSLFMIAGYVGALFVGSIIINSDLLSTVFSPVADLLDPLLPVSGQTIKYVIMFSALGVIAAVLLYLAYTWARPFERRVVLTLIGMMLVVSVFVGPINALSIQGWSREWLFAEDFGQVLTLALLTGFTSGLVVATTPRR